MTPRLKSLSVSLAVAAGLALPSTASNAASDWMNDYFNSAGAGLNVTPSAVYESQSQTTMSLGGFAYRAPQRATQFFSFSPPGYKAGCGGIDAWLGAYGFVNMDQFVAALRNIGQNAIGYFFQLALKTMAPEIDGLLTDLSKTMNGLNQFQISSCQAIKQFVGTTPDTRNMDMEQRAQVFGSALTGSYGSFFNAQNDTQTDPAKMQAAY
ncbi:MAG: conjugal transfer protein TraH, partial [Thiobacillus sp.]|nr:conjugal transfer protein TraH [Thiobacillus sp.]